MDKRTVSSALRTKQFNNLVARGLELASTDRQLANGTIVLRTPLTVTGSKVPYTYKVYASGAIRANSAASKKSEGMNYTLDYVLGDGVDLYRTAFTRVNEMFERKLERTAAQKRKSRR